MTAEHDDEAAAAELAAATEPHPDDARPYYYVVAAGLTKVDTEGKTVQTVQQKNKSNTTPDQHELAMKPDAQAPLDEAIDYATRMWSAEVFNGKIELVHTLPIPSVVGGHRTRFDRRLTLYPSPAHDLIDRVSRTAAARFKIGGGHIEAALVTFQKMIEAGNPMTVKEIVALAMLTQRTAKDGGAEDEDYEKMRQAYSMPATDWRPLTWSLKS